MKQKKEIATSVETQESEREKLIKLIQVWRGKFEKLYAASQQFDQTIQDLERENNQLKDEKETVSKKLTEKLFIEREKATTRISELLTMTDTAAKEKEVETRDLKTKLHRLETEMQPIINIYKQRDDKMQKKVEKFEQENKQLRTELGEIVVKLQETDAQRIEEIVIIKRNHQKSLLRLKMQNAAIAAAKIEVMKGKAEQNLKEKLKEGLKQENKEKRNDSALKPRPRSSQRSSPNSFSEINPNLLSSAKTLVLIDKNGEEERKEMEEMMQTLKEKLEIVQKQKQVEVLELKAEINSLVAEKRKIVQEYSAQVLKLRKKIELGRLKTKQREETVKYLKSVIDDANVQLSTNRKRRNIIRKTSLKIRELSRQLVVTIQETRSIEKMLKKWELQKEHDGIFEANDVLRLEVLYSAKISEATRLRRLIHDKLIEEVYRPQSPVGRACNPATKSVESRPLSEGLTNDEDDADHDDGIVFLKSGYGSESESQASLDGRYSDSQEEVPAFVDRGDRRKIAVRRDHQVSMRHNLTDRTSWLREPKHYSTINMI